jgi:hypothetical protein
MKDLRKVAKPSKDNWKMWVNIGNDLIDEYEEILGLSEPEIDDTGYRDKIRDSITSVKDMFALLEAESAFKKRQKRKDLDDRWNYWKKVILKAYKDVPGPAKDAYKNIIRRRDKIYFAATDSSDPALGGSSGFDSGTTSTGTFTGSGDDVEADAIDTQQNTIKFQGKRVPKLNKDNWKQWIVKAQRLLAKYPYTYGSRKKTESINKELRYFMQLVEKPKDNIDWSKIEPMSGDDERDWKQIRNMFSAMGATLPDEATNAWKDLEFQKSKGDVDVKTKQRAYGDTDDPALGGSSGFDPGTTSTGDFTGSGDDVEADAMLANLPKQSGMGMQSQIDPGNRVAKDQKNRDGYTERIQRLMYSLNMGDLKNSVRKAKTELRNITAQLPNAEAAKYSTIFYSLLAKKLGLQGFVRSDRIVFADGSTEKVDAKNEEHEKIVRAQYDLGLIDNIKANKLVDLFGLNDLPSQSGMAQQMQAGTKGFKNTGELKLKGTSKTLPPLTSDTYKEYLTAYQKILRKYKSGSGKGGGYKDLSKESIAEQIRHTLNLFLVEQPMKINQTDAYDLAAIEKAFQTAAKRKTIKPAEHDIFKKVLQQRDEITKQSASTKGSTPDTLKKAMDIKAPGSDTNYGVFNDQVMAVINNPSPENLIKQAEAAAAMDLDGFDTDRMKFSAFYGHVAKAMGLTGLITHRNSFMNSPMVVSSKARKTDFSNKMPDMLPFGEYSVEAVDFDNPQHKAVAQAQLNKNLLPASIQMSSTNTVDDVYKRFGITKQEPQEPEKTGDVSPTVKSGERGKASQPTDLDAADELQAAGTGQTTSTSGRSDRPSADGGQAARKVGIEFGKKIGSKINKDRMPTGTYAYDRYVPIPKNLNRLFRGERAKQYYVDRIPLPGQKSLSNQLQITSDTKGTGFETVHESKFNEARDAIMQFLKDNNTSLIDKAEWEKLKKWNDMAGDGPGGGDILNAPNDRWKTKRKERTSSTSADGQADIDSGGSNPNANNQASSNDPTSNINPASAVGTGEPPGEAVYYDIINSGGQMRQKVWVEYDANGTEVNRGKEGQEYEGKLPTKNEYRNRREAGNASHHQGGQGGNTLGARQGTGHSYGQAGYQGKGSTSDQGRRLIAVPYTGPHQKTSNDHVIKDRQNPYYKSSVYPNKESAERVANSMEKMPSAFSTASDTEQERVNNIDQLHQKLRQQPTGNAGPPANSQGGDDSGTAPVSQQSGNDNTLKTIIDRETEKLAGTGKEDYEKYMKNQEEKRKQQNDNTDFSRLLKNAGLLKEFY